MNFDAIMGFIRHLLTFLGGFLVSANLLEASQIDTLVGALVTLIGLAASIYDKHKRNKE